MSLYSRVPGTGTGQGGDGSIHLSAAAQNLGLMDGSGMGNGMDIDMSLPMDLDLDLGQDAQDYGGLAGQVHRALGSQDHTQDMNMQHAMSTYAVASSQQQQQQQQQHQLQQQQQQQQNQQQEASMSGAGAGPLPTGFGMPVPNNTSTLTEFTKRRNWSQRVIEELKDFLHILTPDGRILYVSPSCKSITGYEPSTLIGKFMAEYVHPDDSGIFMREFNESIASGNSLRFFYRFKKEDGNFMIFECDGHPHLSPEPAGAMPLPDNGLPAAGVCRGFFMMARPYPTRNAALLDSFLEHKIENERLMKRIEELKREEVEDTAEQERLYREHVSSPSRAPLSEGQAARPIDGSSSDPPGATPNYQGMPPPAKPPISNTALTRQNLDSALSAQKPDSIADKMSRYEANSTHLESIELLTGLRYRDGERSHGISTGDTSPALIRGDAGIAILVDRDRDGSKKDKKKIKVADEYVCADCGTLDSPEWRKGPKGPKTLCNACGLRWAKKEKKRGGDEGKTESPNGMHSSQMGGMGGIDSIPPSFPSMEVSSGSG